MGEEGDWRNIVTEQEGEGVRVGAAPIEHTGAFGSSLARRRSPMLTLPFPQFVASPTTSLNPPDHSP